MRRSGSASCMLRPKNSLSSEDLQRLASWVKAGTPPTTVLTVVDNHKQLRLSLGSSSAVVSPQLSSTTAATITTADTTTTATTSACSPSRQMTSSNCVVDRLYILGELQAHANAIRFLCEDAFLFSESTSRSSTKDHEKTKNDDEDAKLISTHHFPPPLPPSVILYLLWNDNSSAQSFADGTITDCVRRCLHVNGEATGGRGGANKEDDGGGGDCEFICDEDSNDMCLRRRYPPQQWYLHHEGGIRRQQQQQQQHLTRIYVVVDRISSPLPSAPPLLERGNPSSHQSPMHHNNADVDNEDAILHHRYNCEVTLAKQIARAASTSIYLRERIDGITIGVASDDCATPGLEACMDAVERGAKERRKCAARRLVGYYRGRRRGSSGGGGGGGGRISTWFTTPSSLSASAIETTESNNNNNTDVRDDEVDGNTKTRRNYMLGHIRDKSPERSSVAIVAMHPKDLERVPDHHHHHHNQLHQEQPNTATNILQCRVSTEWNGNGECNSFTDRAMGDWREVWEHHVYGGGGDDDRIINKEHCTRSSSRRFNSRPKVSRIWRGGGGSSATHDHMGGDFEEEQCNEPISTVMVIVFLVAAVSHVWYTYGDIIHSCLLSVFYVRNS